MFGVVYEQLFYVVFNR